MDIPMHIRIENETLLGFVTDMPQVGIEYEYFARYWSVGSPTFVNDKLLMCLVIVVKEGYLFKYI